MAGTLYIVATPIGNLDDMPPRVAATFGAADFIAAEDTRVTMKLLNFLGLKKPMVSYYEHALQKGEGILRRIEEGENCALCSDAGMPCVSDPGEVIVRDALARGIKVVPVPAASACVTALAAFDQVVVFYTHGHMYGVKYDLDTLADAAAARGAEVALFGHTHKPIALQKNGVFLFNPGSCGRCYTGPNTYGVMLLDKGKITSFAHKEVPQQ